jgi:predicted metal-dependent hydrolase
LKLLRQSTSQNSPEPQQLSLQLDFFTSDFSAQPPIDHPAPKLSPTAGVQLPLVPTVVPAGKRRLIVNEIALDYVLVRAKRRTIGFLIDDDGLHIRAPKWVPVAEIESAIREKQRWIFAKLNERRERSARRLQPQMHWRDGGTLPFLGADITLRIANHRSAGIAFDAELRELTVCLPVDAVEQQLKDRVQGWLQQEAKRIFAERLPVYAEKLGVQYRSFALSSAATQWGSCTAEGKIRLNWRLIHFAPQLIDYVIAHELAHLREMNHSPRFWATVQSVFPEFQSARKALRDHAPETLPIF